MWSDLSTYSDWSNEQSLMTLVTELPRCNAVMRYCVDGMCGRKDGQTDRC